eukprot:snap_masked-scaffold_6-processed-gene-11.53-mRNA-1 protein AED:1.00 eAED:1.00 QI:0/0/0/0/1/1/4/0/86
MLSMVALFSSDMIKVLRKSLEGTKKILLALNYGYVWALVRGATFKNRDFITEVEVFYLLIRIIQFIDELHVVQTGVVAAQLKISLR